MIKKCPKCEFENNHTELTPLSECPICGVIYSKYEKILKRNSGAFHTSDEVRNDIPKKPAYFLRIWKKIRAFYFEEIYPFFYEKEEKSSQFQEEGDDWIRNKNLRKNLLDPIYTKKASEIRDSIYRKGHGSILKKFINKYSSYSESDLSKLNLLLSSKEINLNVADSTEEYQILKYDTKSFSLLKKILDIEKIEDKKIEEERKYNQFKKYIIANKPKNLHDYIKEYVVHFDQSGSHLDYLRLFRLLKEKGLSHTDDQVQELLKKAREEIEIMAFEENLSNPEPNCLIDDIDIMSGEAFELCLSDLYEKMGYVVESTPVTGDQGADLIITKHGIRSIIQAKRYSGTVGNSAVQQAIAALSYYQGNKAVVITNNYFTKSAVKLAKSANVELIDRDKLHSLIEKFY
jgi:restriction endonuclease Mrr